ncbi:MAG: hypothetical protein AMXMBFR64_23370 [Myxococcales bacterium]
MSSKATDRGWLPQDTPCVWVGAGVLAWRPCDRALDCDNCPLDAALRGRAAPASRGRSGMRFPADRDYAAGHFWLKPWADGGLRVGIDSMLADLLAEPAAVSLPRPGAPVADGALCVTVDTPEGVVELASPTAGRVTNGNAALLGDPGLLVRDPYGDGWLLDLAPAGKAKTMSAREAEHQARIDAHHFQRRVAMELLMATEVGPTMADGGEPLANLRDLASLVGGRRHLDLVRELLLRPARG